MSDKPPTLPPASEPFPGSRTPGWNDPPTLPYNPLTAPTGGTGRPKLNLNKRVAFPLQGMGGPSGAKPTAIVQPNQSAMPPPALMPLPHSTASAANSNQPIAVVHPMPNMNAPPPSAPRVPPTSGGAVESIRSAATASVALPNDAEEFTFRCLREQVSHVPESVNVRREEIERRLGLMEQLWQSGNLSSALQLKLYQLSRAIASKTFKEAMDTYTALVMNHSNDCAAWAVALRHIVLTVQTANNVLADAVTTVSVSSDSNVVPAMFVPAMPRGSNSSNEMPTQVDAGSHSTVQHI